MNTLRITSIALLSIVVLASCFDMEMELDVHADGRSEITGSYRIEREVWELGVFDDENPNRAFPVSRRDMEELTGLYDGVTLERFRVREEDTSVRIEYRIETADPDALAQIWAGFSQRAVQTEFSPAGRSITLPITSGSEITTDEAIDLVRSRFAQAHYRLTVRTPAPIAELGVLDGDPQRYLDPQTGVGTDNAVVDTEIADLVLDRDPYVLFIAWE